MLSFSVDRTGFPIFPVAALGLEVQLLPVCKVQMEAFIAEPNEFGDRWYDSLLSVNPRRSWRSYSDEKREESFVTGIIPEEAEAFADWLGNGFRLPTLNEWQTLYHQWHQSVLTTRKQNALNGRIIQSLPNPSVGRILLEESHAETLAELSLMRHGVLEWVRDGSDWKGLGEPRDSFSRQLFSWRTPVTPLSFERRLPEFGFRLVRSL
jgi:hypothetical protein